MAVEGLGPGAQQEDVAEQVAVQIRYAGYLSRQHAEIRRQQRAARQTIPDDFDYRRAKGLSAEVLEKLESVRPQTVEHARRIPVMTPAAMSQLLVWLELHREADIQREARSCANTMNRARQVTSF